MIGDQEDWRLEFQEKNFLGLGTKLELEYGSDVERDETVLSYYDPNVAGSWWRTELSYADRSDGFRELVRIERPFYALTTPWAIGGAKALQVVAAAAKDSDVSIQDVGSRLLGDWMSPDAAPVLLDLAETAKEEKYRIRAVRGYLQIAGQLKLPVWFGRGHRRPWRARVAPRPGAAGTGSASGGRPSGRGKKTPEILNRLRALWQEDTAGDPTGKLGLWTGKRLRSIRGELARLGLRVCPNTVRRLLGEIDYALHANRKSLSANSSPLRDEPFGLLHHQREQFSRSGYPIISVDTKKKELVGQFENNGRGWGRAPILVLSVCGKTSHGFAGENHPPLR